MANLTKLRSWLSQHQGQYPARDSADCKHLARWIDNQRTTYEKGRMHKNRQTLLERLPSWTWGAWDVKFEQLEAWLLEDPQQRTSHYPERTSTCITERTLANWVNEQRRAFGL